MRLKKTHHGLLFGLIFVFWPLTANSQSAPLPQETKRDTVYSEPSARELTLLKRIADLEERLTRLEARLGAVAAGTSPQPSPASASPNGSSSVAPTAPRVTPNAPGDANGFLADTTFNVTFDGYYGYNFNRPYNRANLLRPYDVKSNSFSLNQAAIVIEQAPNVAAGRRHGFRLDLQYGQATETLQGNPNNELRPQTYRPVFQAYGTYVVPVGNGLTVDFGKWASSLGFENNYAKDQMNYSRSYWFNFLPFYHFGFRSNYAFNDRFNVTHWLVNGINQSEDFNGFKSQAVLLNLKPTKRVSWNVNYFRGIENRDGEPVLNPGFPAQPTQPGISTTAIRPVPRGVTHIINSYAAWNATDKLTLAADGSYVVNRIERTGAPARVTGGAAYARYQFTPKFALAGRGEYLSDRGGLFSGVTQALKETTLTAEYKFAEGFLIRGEWRRDFSNRPFFLTNVPGQIKKEQNTATLGMIWWFGKKQGSW